MKDGWFGPTGLGIGLRPTGLQGWLVTVIFLLAALARLTHGMGPGRWVAMGCLVTVYFIVMMLTTEEKA